ncbi:MAG: GerMN domain-containing protein [Bacillaceae bacterium]|nr:GerMN domain-containing protein [Bacillaceae bacterium]
MMSRKWMVALILYISAALLLTGCGLFGPEEPVSQPIDPPPADEVQGDNTEVTIDITGEEEAQPSADESATEGENAMFESELYVYDPEGNVVPLTLPIPKTEGIGKQVLRYMVKGGPVESLLPEGFSPVLPEGTEILGMTIDENGVATVDFSPEFAEYHAEEEQHIIDAITWALTQFDSVKSVKIWINGYPQEVMPVNGTPISSLSRENGINLELANNIDIGNTSKVTLYFLSETEDFTYFVPVTRVIPKTDNMALATIEQLIKGPKQGSYLYSGILPSTRILSATVMDDRVVADFDETLLDYNSGSASPDAVKAIVLSLAANTGVSKVQLQVNGETNFMAGNMDLSQPVVRPLRINTYSF